MLDPEETTRSNGRSPVPQPSVVSALRHRPASPSNYQMSPTTPSAASALSAATVRAVWLADPAPDRVRTGPAGRFVFIPDSRPDEVDGSIVIDAAGPPGVLRTVQFARGQTDKGL